MKLSSLVGICVILLGLIGFVLACSYLISAFQPPVPVVTSQGPTVTKLESLGLLTVMRAYVADVLQSESDFYKGSWLIKGDALFAIDCRQAEVVSIDEELKRGTILLPPPTIIQPRVDHRRTKTWDVEKTTWIPWRGDEDKSRDFAMEQAQLLVEQSVKLPEMGDVARENAKLAFTNMYRLVGWEIQIEWADRAKPGDVSEKDSEQK